MKLKLDNEKYVVCRLEKTIKVMTENGYNIE